MLKRELGTLKFSDLLRKLLHLVLSHHGEVKNGWGSPLSPRTPEAFALHHAENLDAKVKGSIENAV